MRPAYVTFTVADLPQPLAGRIKRLPGWERIILKAVVENASIEEQYRTLAVYDRHDGRRDADARHRARMLAIAELVRKAVTP